MQEAIFARILQEVSEGKSLRAVCTEDWAVSRQAFFQWLEGDTSRLDRYARAKEASADVLAEEIVDLADEAMRAATSEQAQAYRLRVDARKWVAAKLKPKKYGERLEHSGTGKDGSHIVRVITGVPPPDDIGKQL